MQVNWIPYEPGDKVPDSPSGYYWVYCDGRVEIGTREYNGGMTYIWRTDQGVDDLVTHYAPMEWPEGLTLSAVVTAGAARK